MRKPGKELEENISNVEYVYRCGIDYVPIQTCIQMLSKAILFILRNMRTNHEE